MIKQRIMYVCSECAEGCPEACGHYDRTELRVMPDGAWLCESCFDNNDDNEFLSWGHLPAPEEYGRIPVVAQEAMRLLAELHAIVVGECPSLLNEDSGGNGKLDLEIRDLIEATTRENRHELPGHKETMAGLRSLSIRRPEYQSGEIPERETWWLIERPGPIYTKGPIDAHPDWTTDPWRARRFTTAREADDARLSIAVDQYRDACSVIEHMFINKTPRQLSSLTEGSR